jgi:hypothetical protein
VVKNCSSWLPASITPSVYPNIISSGSKRVCLIPTLLCFYKQILPIAISLSMFF